MKKEFDFCARRKLFVIISLCIMAVGVLFNVIFGTSMDVSFTGGTLMRYSFTGTMDTEKADSVAKQVLGNEATATVETVNDTEVLSISLPQEISMDAQEELDKQLDEAYTDNKLEQFSTNSLKASMGFWFFIKCLVAVGLAALFLLVYVGLRFRKIGGVSAGAMALLALLHDLLIVYFVFVIFRIQLNDNFVAVMLTILGYSLNDTIVIYDRIRENRQKMGKGAPVAEIVNRSLNQSFVRTRNTTISTLIAVSTVAIVALILRIDSIISFAVPLFFGLVSGFYSSVCLSSPLWAAWVEHKEKRAKKAS